MNKSSWLVVDLDQSLIKTDLFVEVFLRALLTRPHLLLRALFINGFSIPKIKAHLATEIPIVTKNLPFNESVLRLIQNNRKNGKKILLATGATEYHAKSVAEHLGLFDGVLSSNSEQNLKGTTKLNSIRQYLKGEPFDYVGDCKSDFPIFEKAKTSYLVRPTPKLKKTARKIIPKLVFIDDSTIGLWEHDSQILRPYQWMKNIVFFMPAITSIGLYDYNHLWLVLPTFSIMSLLASVVYIFNDIADIESDRSHPTKKNRSFACGEISIKFGFITGISLLLFSIAVLAIWQPTTLWCFAVYFLLTVAYTMFLKEVAILDIFVLVSFYMIRIMIGIETLQVPYSLWFISFCSLLFANLAFLKRFIEVNKSSGTPNPRRKYNHEDKELLRTCGIVSIFASMVILMIYTKSEDFSNFYRHKEIFSLTCIPYALLMLKMWYLGSRGKVDSDPLVFVIKTPLSYLALIASCIILYLAR